MLYGPDEHFNPLHDVVDYCTQIINLSLVQTQGMGDGRVSRFCATYCTIVPNYCNEGLRGTAGTLAMSTV